MLPNDKRRASRADGEGRGAGSQDQLGGAEEGAGRAYEAIPDQTDRNGELEGMLHYLLSHGPKEIW